MSYDVPPALIQHKRDHLAADATLRELSARLPRAIDIVNGDAVISAEDQQAWDEAWRRAQTAAVNVQLDPWWLEVDDRRKARAALLDAVQQG